MPDAAADTHHYLSDGCEIDSIQLLIVSVAAYGTFSFFWPLDTFPAGYPVYDAISGPVLSCTQSLARSYLKVARHANTRPDRFLLFLRE